MSIEKAITDRLVKQAIDNLDLETYQKEVNKAVETYFKSENFKDAIVEALEESGVGYDIGTRVGDSIVAKYDFTTQVIVTPKNKKKKKKKVTKR